MKVYEEACCQLTPDDGYFIAGKVYSQAECEAVYEFWKTRLVRSEIEGDIRSVLSKWKKTNPDFVEWVQSNFTRCTDAVAQDREQDELLQRLQAQDNEQVLLNSVETCLYELFEMASNGPFHKEEAQWKNRK